MTSQSKLGAEAKSKSVIIVGASHAAAQAAVSLRQGGWNGDITLIGEEAVPPYHRPPLSKDYLSGQKSVEDILIRPEDAYAAAGINLRLGMRVTAIGRESQTVETRCGEIMHYNKLILATGARVRRLPIPGADLERVYYLRNIADVSAIEDRAREAKSTVIIGGGYIGLEAAASLRQQGLDVTVIEAMPRILQRVTAPEMSQFYKRIHSEEGVRILEGVTASEVKQDGDGLCVMTSCQKELAADMVIIGIGVIPNAELAHAAGLDVDDGIVVNGFCQTSDPDIYAIGDVAWHHNAIYDTHIRLESVPNATEQGKTAASHISGVPKLYNSLPWFWSDQYDLKLQIAGLSKDYDRVVIRGDISNSRSFAAYYFKGKKFIAVDAVNAPRDFMFGKLSLTRGDDLDPQRLVDVEVPLKQCVL